MIGIVTDSSCDLPGELQLVALLHARPGILGLAYLP